VIDVAWTRITAKRDIIAHNFLVATTQPSLSFSLLSPHNIALTLGASD
jgi:hypothetical protein